MSINKKMGRPKVISDAELVKIVDLFFLTIAGENSGVMGEHGIYEQIARFANEKIDDAPKLRGYHFSRCSLARDRIETLAGSTKRIDKIGLAFVRVNMSEMKMKPKVDILKCMSERENYFLEIYSAAVAVAEENKKLRGERQRQNEAFERQNAAVEHKNKQIEELEYKNKMLAAQQQEYKKIINGRIAEERAEVMRTELPQAGVVDDDVIEKMKEIAEQGVEELKSCGRIENNARKKRRFDPIELFGGKQEQED